MTLPEIFQWVKFGNKSGTLTIERQEILKKIYLEDGCLVAAISNEPKDYLGQVLICYGLITEEKLNEAYQAQEKNRELLGRILVREHEITEKQILDALKIKVEEAVYDIFLWEDGKFIFSETLPTFDEHARLEVPLPVDHVLFEGARRHDEWANFRKEFPDDDVVFAKDSKKKFPKELASNFIIKKVYENVDGHKSMSRILLETHVPEYRGLEAFGKLYWGGCITKGKKVSAKAKGKKEARVSTLETAMNLYKEKKLEQAYIMLDEYLLQREDDSEGRALYGIVAEAYRKSLVRQCPMASIPQIEGNRADLNTDVLSSEEGFFLARIDGKYDIKGLCVISPLGELDSLRILVRLIDKGLIGLKKKGFKK